MNGTVQLLAIGLNYHSAAIDIRECFAFPPERITDAHQSLCALKQVQECVILSTCNRSDIYLLADTDAINSPAQLIMDWLHQWFDLGQRYDEHFYCHHGQQATQHLLRVCAGLDSLVLGEPQISGQVKQALAVAQQAATEQSPVVGTILKRLFDNAFTCNKTIRTTTELGQHPVTVPYASISLARQIFVDLTQANILLVGAGEMIELCAQHFAAQPVASILIANRSQQRANNLAKQLLEQHPNLSCKTLGLSELSEHISTADIIITSTASQKPLITKAMLKQGLKQRRYQPVLAVDIAVPRNIEPQANDLNDVYLYSIDDLTAVLESNREQRATAAAQAQSHVERYSQDFMQWLALHQASEQLQTFRSQAAQHQQALLTQSQRELLKGESPDKVLAQFAQRFTQRTLHGLTQAMRQAAIDDNPELLSALQRLFAPDNEQADTPPIDQANSTINKATQ